VHITLQRNGARIRLFNEDCIAGMNARLQAGSVNVVVTSPPYNLGVRYSQYDDAGSRADYLNWLDAWAVAVKRVLHEAGSLFLNVGSKPTDAGVPFQVLAVMQRHFTLQNTFHWIKSIAINKADVGHYGGITQDIAVGHYKPINSPRFVNDCHEYVFHLTHRGDVPLDRLAVGVPYRDKTNVARWGRKQDVRCRGNTWFVPYETIKSRDKQRPHPATFPPQLAGLCVRLHGVERAQLVLDPFAGIGSSAIACAQLGVPFIGFEIDATYLEAAKMRLQSLDLHKTPVVKFLPAR
jgi:site-specific DNA-methyltransferase (adenine-specific)